MGIPIMPGAPIAMPGCMGMPFAIIMPGCMLIGRVPCLHNTLANQMHLHLAGVHILYLPSAAGLNLSILLCNFRLTSWHGKWQTPDHIVSRCGHSGLH